MPDTTNLPRGERPVTSNDEPSDADEAEVDCITTRDGPYDVNETAHQRSGKLSNDVS